MLRCTALSNIVVQTTCCSLGLVYSTLLYLPDIKKQSKVKIDMTPHLRQSETSTHGIPSSPSILSPQTDRTELSVRPSRTPAHAPPGGVRNWNSRL